MLTQAELQHLLHYDPLTGLMVWRNPRSNRVKAGAEVGFVSNGGYKRANIGGKFYLLHRLAWLYVFGYLPKERIDHEDRNKLNNAWDNLRLAPGAMNQRNCSLSKNNTSGIAGVRWVERWQRWSAEISADSKPIWLGLHDSLFEAAATRKSAENKLGYSPGHGT